MKKFILLIVFSLLFLTGCQVSIADQIQDEYSNISVEEIFLGKYHVNAALQERYEEHHELKLLLFSNLKLCKSEACKKMDYLILDKYPDIPYEAMVDEIIDNLSELEESEIEIPSKLYHLVRISFGDYLIDIYDSCVRIKDEKEIHIYDINETILDNATTINYHLEEYMDSCN